MKVSSIRETERDARFSEQGVVGGVGLAQGHTAGAPAPPLPPPEGASWRLSATSHRSEIHAPPGAEADHTLPALVLRVSIT